MVEASAVTPQGRISARDLGIWDDAQIEGLSGLVDLVHEQGAKIGIQLAHAGRKASIEGSIIAPSAIRFDETYKTPLEMSEEQIAETVQAFASAAARARQAGFDLIEIHAAHGYLINQFLSPLVNKRTDPYGGSAENRYRFLKEIISAVKMNWHGPVFTRISANDYHPDGLTPDDYVEIAGKMKAQGIDLIDCSSGAVVPNKIDVYPGYQVPYAEKIKHGTDIPTGAVGLITGGAQAEEILARNQADLIFLARVLLRDPYWPRTAAAELGVKLEAPEPYKRGWM